MKLDPCNMPWLCGVGDMLAPEKHIFNEILIYCCEVVNTHHNKKIYKNNKNNKKLFKSLFKVSGFKSDSDTVNTYKLCVINYNDEYYLHFYVILKSEQAAIFYIIDKDQKLKSKKVSKYIIKSKKLLKMFDKAPESISIGKLDKKYQIDHVINHRGKESSGESTDETIELKDTESKNDNTADIMPIDNNTISDVEKSQFYNQISKFLTVADKKMILFLLGFFLFARNNKIVRNNDNRYQFAVNLIYKDLDKATQLYSLIYFLVYGKADYKSIHIFKNTSKTPHPSHTKLFKKMKGLNLLVIPAQFTNTYIDKFSCNLDTYYKKNIPAKKHANLVVFSNKELSSVCKKSFDFGTFDENIAVELKKDTIIAQSISAFKKYMNSAYSPKKTINLKDTKNNIFNSSTMDNRQSCMYAPVIYFLNMYFSFLKENDYLTDEQYNSLEQDCRSLYIPAEKKDTNPSDDINNISHFILNSLLSAYDNGKFKTSEKISDEPIIYTGAKSCKELICFEHDEKCPLKNIIIFLEEVEGDKVQDLKNVLSDGLIQKQLKKCWQENQILKTSGKSGATYNTKSGTYIAFIPEKLREALN